MFLVTLSVLIAGPSQTAALRIYHSRHPEVDIRHPHTSRETLVFVMIYLTIGATAAAVGITCMPVTGLRSPVFESMAAYKPFWQGLDALWIPALLAGAAAGVLAQVAAFILLRNNPETGARMLSSHGRLTSAGRVFIGGIFAEIVFRFGAVQLAAWAAIRLGVPAAQAAWVGVLVSGLFAAAAITTAHRVVGLRQSGLLVVLTYARQLLIALTSGAIFIKYGLFAAMVAHITFLLLQLCAEPILRQTQPGRA